MMKSFKGIAKETKMICEHLSKGGLVTEVYPSKLIMENGWDVLKMVHDEIFSVDHDCVTAATEARAR
jgi:hypothetical protein